MKRTRPEGAEAWWDSRTLEPAHGLRWRFGPLDLFIFRLAAEWQIGHASVAGEEEPEGWSVEEIAELPGGLEKVERFVPGGVHSTVTLRPRLADRPLVAKPRMPLLVLPGEETRIYVSAPVRIAVTVGDSAETLREVPVRRLSDTWFGSSTLDGEVAYALKTHARAQLEEMPKRTYRTITPVVIRNESKDVLPVDRVSLPVPYLSIWATPDGFLWTEQVTLVRSDSPLMAGLDIGKRRPEEAEGAQRISEAREVATSNLFVRAFSTLLSPFAGED